MGVCDAPSNRSVTFLFLEELILAKPNTKFSLSVRDIDIIERALRTQLDKKIEQNDEQAVKEIRDVLGRIHNQKNWFRPKEKPYVSG